MSRQEILDQIEQAFGFVPGYLVSASDHILEKWWSELAWHQSAFGSGQGVGVLWRGCGHPL
jgi:hypothetical protein